MKVRACELCPSDAAVFCPSDAAFLCWSCDANIHEANFLVARHVRQSICSDDSVCISSTTKENSDGDSCSTTSSSSGRRRRPSVDHFKAEGIFVNWCGKLGMEELDLAVQMACKALKVCLDGRTVLPFRVCLAASMWLGFKLTLDNSLLTSKVLKRFEEISGVPAKIILAAVSKLDRALSKQHNNPLHLQEGWAETQT